MNDRLDRIRERVADPKHPSNPRPMTQLLGQVILDRQYLLEEVDRLGADLRALALKLRER